MAKKDGRNWTIVGIVIAVLLVGGYIMFQPKADEPQGKVDVGSDIPATDVAGVCTAREGVLVGMCCSKLVNNRIVPADCEDLIEPKAPLEAFFQLGSGSRLVNLPGVYFIVRAENEGNLNTRVRVGSVDVTSVQGGDAEALARIKEGFETLKLHGWKTVAKSASVDFAMDISDIIIIDQPGVYQMTDGTYSIVIKMEAEDANGAIIPAGERTIQIIIEQEVVSFNVDVEQA